MIYELIEPMEGYSLAKFNHVIDELNVNCDLGEYENEVFVGKYTSAVVPKVNLLDYEDA